MVAKSNTGPKDLGPLANQLTSDYGWLASENKPAAVAAENEDLGAHIKHWV
jgi:talin